jgi:hypothetical protein
MLQGKEVLKATSSHNNAFNANQSCKKNLVNAEMAMKKCKKTFSQV